MTARPPRTPHLPLASYAEAPGVVDLAVAGMLLMEL
ncbi:Uncharacterised protein [Actinomadura madurae]|nr:Uncharacterised protein [Actinomadura madurae]